MDVVLSKFVFTYIGTFVIPNSVEKQRLIQHDAAIHRLAENPVVKIGICSFIILCLTSDLGLLPLC